jgi:hypothetical protein
VIRLIEVEYASDSKYWHVYARRSADDQWERFAGPEADLPDLLDLARDVVTGG